MLQYMSQPDLSMARPSLSPDTTDLREAIGRITEQRPGAPLSLYSISAGTALMVQPLVIILISLVTTP